MYKWIKAARSSITGRWVSMEWAKKNPLISVVHKFKKLLTSKRSH